MTILPHIEEYDTTADQFRQWYQTSGIALPELKVFMSYDFRLQLGVWLEWVNSINLYIANVGNYFTIFIIDESLGTPFTHDEIVQTDMGYFKIFHHNTACDNPIDGYFKGLIEVIRRTNSPF